MNDPEKRWKFQLNDQKSIDHHDAYVQIYGSIFTHSQAVPWHIIPSGKKWYKNYLILQLVVEQLEMLTL